MSFAVNQGNTICYWPFSIDPWFQRMVEDASDGRLILDTKINMFKDGEVPLAVRDGRADAGRFHPAFISGTFPLWDYLTLPFVFDNIYQFERARHDSRLRAIYDESYGEQGLVQLVEFACDGNVGVWAKQPITKVEDFQGVKTRAMGIIASLQIKTLGGSPLTIGITEVADAMLKGTIDAALSDRSAALGFGFADAATYFNRWDWVVGTHDSIVINKEVFDALPPDLQDVLMDVSDRMSTINNFTVAFSGPLTEQAIAARGLEVLIVDKEELAKAEELIKETVAQEWLGLEGVGADGAQVLEILAEYRTK